MTKERKFKGKIRDNPLVALERGSKEVMASLWEEYLREVIPGPLAAERRRRLKEDIEAAADFARLYGDWNDLTVPDRAQRWMALMESTKRVLQEVRERCIRCGECCEKSSPTLTAADMRLFRDNILGWTDVYTLRRGEKAASQRSPETVVLTEERLKVREHPGTRTCIFYATDPNRCLIYEERPEQCRQQLCWLMEEEREEPAGTFLQRQDLFGDHPELWELLEKHEERCNLEKLTAVFQALAAGEAEAEEQLFDMLHFDHYLRQMFIQEWGITSAATELLLGRPLAELVRHFGLRATMTPEGVFTLERRG